MRRIVLVLGAAILVACGGDDGADRAPIEREAAPTASVDQYASVVAEHRDQMLGAIADIDECRFRVDVDPFCAVTLTTSGGLLDATLAVFIRDLDALEGPPQEIEALVERTLSEATEVQPAAAALADCGDGEDCASRAVSLFAEGLAGALRAWGPHLN